MVDDFKRGAERAGDRAAAAREAVGEKATAAREAMGERAVAMREAAAESAANVRESAANVRDAAAESAAAAKEKIAAVKPRFRGVSHEWAFFTSIGLGIALIAAAVHYGATATVAVAIYAVSLSALLGTSALYHRVNWQRPKVRAWMRRLDHSMIFFLIAGTYTPFALLVLNGPLADAILAVVWIGAIVGAIVEMIWIDHPKWVGAIIYVSLGWVAIAAFPQMVSAMGLGVLLVAGGGLLYTSGAVVYATQRPNPRPTVFGYHEVFHLFVIAAAAAHFAAVAFFALPAA